MILMFHIHDQSPVNPTCMHFVSGRMQEDGAEGTWRKPAEAQGEHANSTR